MAPLLFVLKMILSAVAIELGRVSSLVFFYCHGQRYPSILQQPFSKRSIKHNLSSNMLTEKSTDVLGGLEVMSHDGVELELDTVPVNLMLFSRHRSSPSITIDHVLACNDIALKE